ncbi:MAG: hypothetical protein WBQ36_05220 [Desulfobaccales bacterium]
MQDMGATFSFLSQKTEREVGRLLPGAPPKVSLYLCSSPPGSFGADMLIISISQSLLAFSWKISKKIPAQIILTTGGGVPFPERGL